MKKKTFLIIIIIFLITPFNIFAQSDQSDYVSNFFYVQGGRNEYRIDYKNNFHSATSLYKNQEGQSLKENQEPIKAGSTWYMKCNGTFEVSFYDESSNHLETTKFILTNINPEPSSCGEMFGDLIPEEDTGNDCNCLAFEEIKNILINNGQGISQLESTLNTINNNVLSSNSKLDTINTNLNTIIGGISTSNNHLKDIKDNLNTDMKPVIYNKKSYDINDYKPDLNGEKFTDDTIYFKDEGSANKIPAMPNPIEIDGWEGYEVDEQLITESELEQDQFELDQELIQDQFELEQELTQDHFELDQELVQDQFESDQELTQDQFELDQELTQDQFESDQELTQDQFELDQELTQDQFYNTYNFENDLYFEQKHFYEQTNKDFPLRWKSVNGNFQ